MYCVKIKLTRRSVRYVVVTLLSVSSNNLISVIISANAEKNVEKRNPLETKHEFPAHSFYYSHQTPKYQTEALVGHFQVAFPRWKGRGAHTEALLQ